MNNILVCKEEDAKEWNRFTLVLFMWRRALRTFRCLFFLLHCGVFYILNHEAVRIQFWPWISHTTMAYAVWLHHSSSLKPTISRLLLVFFSLSIFVRLLLVFVRPVRILIHFVFCMRVTFRSTQWLLSIFLTGTLRSSLYSLLISFKWFAQSTIGAAVVVIDSRRKKREFRKKQRISSH